MPVRRLTCVAMPSQLSEPIEKEVLIPIFNKRDLGKALKKDQKAAVAHIQEMAAEDEDAARAFDAKLEAEGQATISVGGKDLVITRAMVTFKTCVGMMGDAVQLWLQPTSP